jgi:hypothetical protein
MIHSSLANARCLDYTKQHEENFEAYAIHGRFSSPAGGDLCPRLLQGAGEGRIFDSGAIEAAQGIRRRERPRSGAKICGRGNGQADRPRRLRRNDRLSQGELLGSRDAGREDRPALSEPQGLGHGGRAGRGDALPEEGVVLSRESRSSEKFMHGVKVLMAKNYIDNLSR